MVDFAQLLRTPMSEIKRPPLLPTADYPARIIEFKVGDDNKNKTPYVRFMIRPTAWPDTVREEEKEGIDLSKKAFRKDFFLSLDAQHRFKEFAESIGVAGDTLEESIAGCVGAELVAEIKQEMNTTNNELYNRIDRVMAID